MLPSLWEILRCPQHPDNGQLVLRKGDRGCGGSADPVRELECLSCGLVYPVIGGIVDMLKPFPQTDSTGNYVEAESHQWDRHASRYDEGRYNDVFYMHCLRAGLRALRAQPGDLVLDAGCGTGMGTRLSHHPGLSTVALDLSMASLQYLSRHMTTPGVSCVRADICRLPFASKVFDRAICANALQHIPSLDLRQRCVEQFARVVRSLGTVVVTVHGFSVSKQRAGWEKEGTAGSCSGDVQYIYRYEVQEFRDLLTRNLRVERITGAGLPLPYRLKLSPLSLLLERVLSRSQRSAPWGHMLVGKCIVE